MKFGSATMILIPELKKELLQCSEAGCLTLKQVRPQFFFKMQKGFYWLKKFVNNFPEKSLQKGYKIIAGS